jgi:hypothetical protein
MVTPNEVYGLLAGVLIIGMVIAWIVSGEDAEMIKSEYIDKIRSDYLANEANLEVSDREDCAMCFGDGAVVATPGRGGPYMQICEYCGGCGKMGVGDAT